jgi:alkylhydroperoxidase family enzyme
MRLRTPRINPLSDAELTPAQVEALTPVRRKRDGAILNIYRTLAHAPEATRAFLAWGGYVVSERNSLAPREREIVILRTGYLCRSGYEFVQHTRVGERAGLSAAEIARIKAGAGAPGWSESDAVLLRACEELVRDHFISDAAWAGLAKYFSQRQCMDVVFTTAQYTQVSMMLNAFGVQLDEGQTLDPDLNAY